MDSGCELGSMSLKPDIIHSSTLTKGQNNMKPNLVKIEGSLAARYVNGKFDQMVTVEYNDRVEEDIEYFRVNGIDEQYENSGEQE